MTALLDIANLSVRFGGIKALDDVSFQIAEGQICGLIGPNGAGKTTLFNCLSRFYEAQSGEIKFDGQDLRRIPAHQIVRHGIARTFQNLALFKTLTVVDNVKINDDRWTKTGFFAHAVRIATVGREEDKLEYDARRLIEEVGLTEYADSPVSELNFASQKKVELARALHSQPRLLLLDEPAGGLNHEEVSALGSLIRSLQSKFGIAVLIIEHHLNFVMNTSHKVVALNFGRKIAEGTAEEVQRNEEVIKAYLGTAV